MRPVSCQAVNTNIHCITGTMALQVKPFTAAARPGQNLQQRKLKDFCNIICAMMCTLCAS